MCELQLMKRRVSRLGVALIALGVSLAAFHHLVLDGIPGLVGSKLFAEDTVYASGYSDRAFRRVQTGMTMKQVVELLREPVCVRTDPYALAKFSGSTECWAYSHSPSDTNYRIRLICFRDGLVRAKRAEYWFD